MAPTVRDVRQHRRLLSVLSPSNKYSDIQRLRRLSLSFSHYIFLPVLLLFASHHRRRQPQQRAAACNLGCCSKAPFQAEAHECSCCSLTVLTDCHAYEHAYV